MNWPVHPLRPDPADEELRLTVNGEPMAIAGPMSLAALVALVIGDQRGVAVAVDGQIVPRSAWSDLYLSAGVWVEIVTAAAGG